MSSRFELAGCFFAVIFLVGVEVGGQLCIAWIGSCVSPFFLFSLALYVRWV